MGGVIHYPFGQAVLHSPFIPAQAGIQGHNFRLSVFALGPRFRGDERRVNHRFLKLMRNRQIWPRLKPDAEMRRYWRKSLTVGSPTSATAWW